MKQLIKTCCKSTFVVLLVVALSNAAVAQRGQGGRGGFGNRPPMPPRDAEPDNLYEALKGQNVETTMTADQLTTDWHIISSGEMGTYAMFGLGNVMPKVAGFTRGRIVTFGDGKYLVAYYVMNQVSIYSPEVNRPGKGYLFKDSPLSLALLPLNGNRSFYEIKKFDPEKDFISTPLVRRAESQTNLKQIALATMTYIQDYDEKLPPMVAAHSADEIKNHYLPNAHTMPAQILTDNITPKTTVQSRLLPYVKNEQVFLQPVTKRPYLPNYKVSRLSLSAIKNPHTTFLFYEDAPDAEGMRNVAFVDTHVKAITEAEFQYERKAQGISESGYPSAAKTAQKAKPTPKP